MTGELRDSITGPLVHDMRGALGVIRLATQLLEETQGTAPSHTRIMSACRRLSWYLEELEAERSLLGDEALGAAGETLDWTHVVSQRATELGQDQPRRAVSFVAHSQPHSRASSSAVLLVLNGLVDGAVKTTASKEAITISLRALEPTGLSLEVTAARAALGDTAEEPFRIHLARAVAQQMGGSLEAEWTAEQGYRARLSLPA